ncbi:MFS transporter [Actinoplanes friuliensis]|uniref:Major facilitator transporter n=1 Tax=Actinoplanes friuliensis DSM 7358 TaxID=1246995 RepID=U5VPH2_9ACTN|nr:MFS transporter [Actinoplanes friuliensis]AGZ38712.1 major facilitator transporter [Actinoplanes friuliensis DSM 7358]
MPLLPTIGRTVGTGVKALRMLVRGSVRGSAWATRRVGDARARGAANEVGMVRLFDLHALSCAGDTLIAIGLAGTIFFNVPLGEARSKVALYLLITMVPFALLAPVVGPLLDHFRHGRRYALAVTMLGRAFLAYVISDNLLGWGLYPAAFGVLALSRAYGVARSAAVPRLLPEGIGLSQVGARASVYGTFAGAVVAPIGLAAFWFGPQWPLRVASLIFLVGMVISLRLPPRADSDPPEAVPRPFRAMLRLRRGNDRPLSGKLVISTLVASASFRCLYGFLLLYFAFAVKAGALSTSFLGRDIGSQGAVALVGGSLAVGTFLATAVGTRLRIRRPLALQSSGLTITAGVAVLAAIFFTLPMVALLSLVAAIFSGISKLAVDASIQERVPERLRASAFAHSETVLMIAWVVGGAVGIIPFNGRLGVTVVAVFAVAAAVRGTIMASRLHNERLHGRPDMSADDPASTDGVVSTDEAVTVDETPAGDSSDPRSDPLPDSVTPPAPTGPTRPSGSRPPKAPTPKTGPDEPAPSEQQPEPKAKRRLFPRSTKRSATPQPSPPATPTVAAEPGRSQAGSSQTVGASPASAGQGRTGPDETGNETPAPPGFHIYRPSSATTGNGNKTPSDEPDR